MARLLQGSVEEVEQIDQRRKGLRKETGMMVVLKGRYTIIAFPDGRQVVNITGHPALAKAGSGDLLTGIIGSFIAQGMKPDQAVKWRCYIHGKAGNRPSLLPNTVFVYTDILAQLGPILHQLTSQPTYFPGN